MDNPVGEGDESIPPSGRMVVVDYDWEESRSTSMAVLEGLEEISGRDARSFGPLNDVVDVDALDSLFEPASDGSRGPGQVQFTVDSYVVVVRTDGTILVRPDDGE